jgi:predicted amidohydrolase
LRVRETGLWLASADVCGDRGDRLGLGPTCVLDPTGRVVTQVPPGLEGLAVAEIAVPYPGGLCSDQEVQ